MKMYHIIICTPQLKSNVIHWCNATVQKKPKKKQTTQNNFEKEASQR